MSKIQYQYDLQNLTPANAQPVEANFTKTEQHINQEVIERDGSVAMRAQLKLVGDPVAALDAAPKQYVDQVIPIGLIMMWGAAAAPTNGKWLLCDGAPLETALYPELFAVIGYAWGGSGGSFMAPNLGGKFPLGVNGAHALGTTGGSEAASLPAHDHDIAHTHAASTSGDDTPDHAHQIPAHGHGHNIANAAHNHGPGQGPAYVTYAPGSGQSVAWGAGPEIATPGATDDATSVITGGVSDAGAINTGGVIDNRHRHSTPALSHAGRSSSTGVAPAGTNMPPFLSIPYIIRCK